MFWRKEHCVDNSKRKPPQRTGYWKKIINQLPSVNDSPSPIEERVDPPLSRKVKTYQCSHITQTDFCLVEKPEANEV